MFKKFATILGLGAAGGAGLIAGRRGLFGVEEIELHDGRFTLFRHEKLEADLLRDRLTFIACDNTKECDWSNDGRIMKRQSWIKPMVVKYFNSNGELLSSHEARFSVEILGHNFQITGPIIPKE